jgi:hypothetical protein
MPAGRLVVASVAVALVGLVVVAAPGEGDSVRPELIVRDSYAMDPPHFSKDPAVKIDYDIVYVRAPLGKFVWPDVGAPTLMEPGADLMLLHPDGKEELLVEGGTRGSVADPYVSFDGQTVFYAFFHATEGADIFKIHVPSRKVVRLTHDGGKKAPGTEGAHYSRNDDSMVLLMESFGKKAAERDVIYNTAPCPVPGGKVLFTSNRHGFVPRKGTFAAHAFQLTLMVDDGSNVETVGHLNLGCALHPVILSDGRVMFSSLENQGLRDTLHWSIWTIHPDGTAWAPLISDFARSLAPSFHFQTQRSDGRAVVTMYYNVNQAGFGTHVQLPVAPAPGAPAFGPADPADSRNRPLRMFSGGIKEYRLPFSPSGLDVLTPFANDDDSPSPHSIRKDTSSPRVGKVTHPCGAPDNHILTVWSPNHDCSRDGITGGVRRVGNDTGIYLIKAGSPVYEPGHMLLIKNDPKYHEQWPRPLVPYERIYGIKEPKTLPRLANDGKLSPHLPVGTPYGLIGTASLYKRESAPAGKVPEGSVTAIPTASKPGSYGTSTPWVDQGADAGIYANGDIHAIRIVLQEPNARPDWTRFYNHARERLRILGEIPVRKFDGDKQPTDPDGNPDTSFLAKIPADTSFTFQTLDKQGMVLNMAQTWHQVRPGEVRTDCGGCHAHSQKPTLFQNTFAARPDYPVFDLTRKTPLVTTKKNDISGKKWDAEDTTGLKFTEGVLDVEYWRDIRPIFARSCVACHGKGVEKPPADLVLDDDTPRDSKSYLGPKNVPTSYVALAVADGSGGTTASRYIQKMQSRASLLVWKLFGQRMDGRKDEDIPPPKPGEKRQEPRYAGSIMPPPDAVKSGKVHALSDEDRRTLIRWIDLGCPIDLTYDPAHPDARTGWLADRTLPTLAVASPAPGTNDPLTRILIGMTDRTSGLDLASFSVTADFPLAGVNPGDNLAAKFREKDGVWELKLTQPIATLARGKLTVSVKDRQGNLTRVERSFSVAQK